MFATREKKKQMKKTQRTEWKLKKTLTKNDKINKNDEMKIYLTI